MIAVAIILFSIANLLFADAVTALEDPQKHIDATMVSEILYAPSGREVYASTVTKGLLKSSDGGNTWVQINRGIADPLIYHLVNSPEKEKVFFAASWGGGVYKTGDGGETWGEMNGGLTTTAIGALSYQADRPDRMVAASSQGVYRTENGGEKWVRWNEGLDAEKELQNNTILVVPGVRPVVLLGSDRGVWKRGLTDSRWNFSGLRGMEVTVFKYLPSESSVFAGTSYGGLFRGGFDAAGKFQWVEMNPDFRKFYVRSLLIGKQKGENVIYIGTSDRGVLRSDDLGKTYRGSNRGLEGEEVRALAQDPTDENVLLAGTRDGGIFRSRDGGDSWEPVPFPVIALSDVLEFTETNAAARVKSRPPQPAPPKAFSRCNDCHGWADPILHLHPQTYWRVAPSARDWQYTVDRMARKEEWTKKEKKAIVRYMNRYYGVGAAEISLTGSTPVPLKMGKEFPVTRETERESHYPVVAWTGKDYFVAWQTDLRGDFDIEGRVIGRDGKLKGSGSFPIAALPGDQYFAAIAWGEDQGLVVWEDHRDNEPGIYGARISRDYRILDAGGFPIAKGPEFRQYPRIGWDGERFLVVWEEERPDPQKVDILGVRVSPEGKILDSAPLPIGSHSGDQFWSSVTSGGSVFLVVWTDQRSGSYDIYGTRVAGNGEVLDPQGLAISTSAENQEYPHAAWDGSRFWVVWSDHLEEGAVAVYGARVGPDGDVRDKDGILLSNAAGRHSFPSVLSLASGKSLVMWEEDTDLGRDLFGSLVKGDGEVLFANRIPLAVHAGVKHPLRADRAQGNLFLVWQDKRSRVSNIYGKLVKELEAEK